jgi:nucleoside-diphosphate-sugar epimerase
MVVAGEIDIVTGAFSYTGSYIAERLVREDRKVRTLTRRPRPEGTRQNIEVVPYRWDRQSLVKALMGTETLYNTYWIRLARGQTTFDEAVNNSRLLFEAAKEAGLKRIVHVSVTKADQAPYLNYFAGKAEVEGALKESGVSYAIVRPTVVYGREDVLINNIAWLLRRIPIFVIAGSGDYRVRPVHVDDVARICIEASKSSESVTIDAVGPETMAFEEMVRAIKKAVGGRGIIVHAPRWVLLTIARFLSVVLRDELMSAAELRGLMDELVATDGPATGNVSFYEWVERNSDALGRSYVSEMKRNYRRTG